MTENPYCDSCGAELRTTFSVFEIAGYEGVYCKECYEDSLIMEGEDE